MQYGTMDKQNGGEDLNRKTDTARLMLLCAGFTALLSQVSVAVGSSGFHISVALVLLQILFFALPELAVLPLTAASAAGVFLLRLANAALAGQLTPQTALEHAPEVLFYLCFGALFRLFFETRRSGVYRLWFALPLAAMDALSNFSELLVREGVGAFSFSTLLQITAVGLIRAFSAGLILLALRRYGVQILRREDRERYQKLLFMTADLRSEVVWMEKGAELAEKTMNRAYHLCRSLQALPDGAEVSGEALLIAKDIHEVKKDYALVMRGISSALEAQTAQDGMEISDLFRMLARSTEHFAKETGKTVALTRDCALQVKTARHFELLSIFRNLLHNAVEAAPEDRAVHLQLRARQDGEDAVFEVQDDCGGIAPERLELIFTPGFSSKINRQTGEINRGLGLCIVKDLTEQTLHGSVSVQSENAQTAFTVRIPINMLKGEADADLSH